MNLMNDITHRPWPLPSKNWIMRQTWSQLLFAHWPIRPKKLKPFIPSSLQVDTYGGNAWIGVVVFLMEGVYPRGLTFRSLLPQFAEINVRTYVHFNGKPGVYFMSLDVGDWASYTIAKKWFHLPYYSSQISINKEGPSYQFQSIRKGNSQSPILLKGKYKPLSEVYFPKQGTLDHWLTERYCFYSNNSNSNIYCSEIHHRPWPLQKVEAEIEMNTLFSPFNIDLDETKPIYHFSKGVDSLIWNIRKIRTGNSPN